MNTNYIARALCFHGQPMQKIWEDERGAGNLQQCGVPQHPDYSVYLERQKHFTFQDRAKRLKLHQFFARKAQDLYDAELVGLVMDYAKVSETKPYIATLPPYELFVNKNQDKIKRWRCVLEAVKPGDIVYGMILKVSASASSLVKPLCTAEPLVRYLNDIPIRAFLHNANLSKPILDKRGKPRSCAVNDFVCCEVLEISVDADRLTLGMEGILTKNKEVQLGIVSAEELPAYYRKIKENAQAKYEEYLYKSKEFLNPNYDLLYEINGLSVNDTFTLMGSLKQPFPRADYAKELRQTQASKWAFRSVAEGIEHFKNGHHVEAFQCLNKALNIDPRNVEGLVARGALFANKGSFVKAVDDFEKALKLNAYHVNARKYMGETLVALGRRYEEEGRVPDAAKVYRDCLNIIPNHEQARLSLEAIQQRTGGLYLDDIFNVAGPTSELEKTKKKHSQSSASSSADNSTDSSDSDTESDQSDAGRGRKDASLSPLSKRMKLHVAMDSVDDKLNGPFSMDTGYNAMADVFKLDADDTESRVRKLLHEASKHKKEKSKKSSKKKSKKSKKSKEKNATAMLEKINFQEAYKAISGMNIKNKFTENLQLYNKTIAEIKKRQELLQQPAHIVDMGRKREETPPPKAPSMHIQTAEVSLPAGTVYPHTYASTSAAAGAKIDQPKLSFQIKRPVKIDKFGLVRIATPLAQKSPTRSPRSRSRSTTRERYRRTRSRHRSRSRSANSRRRSRYRSRSTSYDARHRRDRGRYRSRSRTPRSRQMQRRRSPERHNAGGSRHNAVSRRRTPSPFVPRTTPPPRRRSHSRSPGSAAGSRRRNGPPSNSSQHGPKYGNRVWKRDDNATGGNRRLSGSYAADGRWLHDKFKPEPSKVDDGPSIEEIDEIINKAQRERKQEIIKRDKDILKKPPVGQF